MRRAYEIAELAPGLDVSVGSDDVVLELAMAGAPGWIAGIPNALPAECAALWRRAPRGRPGHRGAGLPAAASAAALGLQDRVRAGDQAGDGPGRAVRRPVPAAARAAVRRAGRGGARRAYASDGRSAG